MHHLLTLMRKTHKEISECSQQLRNEYKTRHGWVGKLIHWELCKEFKVYHVVYA